MNGATSHDSDHYVLHVNGRDREVTDSWLGESLLDVLRDRLGRLDVPILVGGFVRVGPV